MYFALLCTALNVLNACESECMCASVHVHRTLFSTVGAILSQFKIDTHVRRTMYGHKMNDNHLCFNHFYEIQLSQLCVIYLSQPPSRIRGWTKTFSREDMQLARRAQPSNDWNCRIKWVDWRTNDRPAKTKNRWQKFNKSSKHLVRRWIFENHFYHSATWRLELIRIKTINVAMNWTKKKTQKTNKTL